MKPFYDNLTPRLLFMIRRRTKHAEKKKCEIEGKTLLPLKCPVLWKDLHVLDCPCMEWCFPTGHYVKLHAKTF